MADVFPEAIEQAYPYSITPVWDTLISTFDSGAEQRRQKSLYPKFDVSIRFFGLAHADAETIWQFYMDQKGSFNAFYFFDPLPGEGITTSYEGLYVGAGDAATEVWDLPGKSTSSQAIYVDGVLQTVTTDYVILTGGGDGSADRVDFVSPPAEAESISCDFTGKLRARCRFALDRLSKEYFNLLLFSYGIQLKGLAGN